MSNAPLQVLQAMLSGLIEGVGATDAAIILPIGLSSSDLLVKVGTMSNQEWQTVWASKPASLLLTPLHQRNENEPIAQLCVYSSERSDWDQETLLAVKTVAIALNKLTDISGEDFNWMQLVASRRILSVTEEELTRLVLDIHDGPVQKLFAALNLLLHARAKIERRDETLQKDDAAKLLPRLIQIIELLELSLGEIRSFLGAFQSMELSKRDLLDVLEALVLQHEQLTDSTVHFDSVARLPTVSTPVKIALYRIIQEALSNAHRHAEVTEYYVRIWVVHSNINIEVVDFGKGFVPPDLDGLYGTEEAKHIGLRGMRDRLHLVGGRLKVESAPGQGTRIHVTVPIS